MTRLVTSGFEIYAGALIGFGNLSPDGTNIGTPASSSRETSGQRSGLSCLRVQSAAGNSSSRFYFTGALDRGYWLRVYVKIATPLGATRSIAALGSLSSNPRIDTTSAIFSNINPSVKSAPLNDGNWHRIEYYVKPSATQASRVWELRVDGTTVASGTGQTLDSGAPDFAEAGVMEGATAGDFYFDDLAVNDSQGAAPHNTWPGDGSNVVLLVPTADSAGGTGWTLGTGTALGGNGFAAVDNLPPDGVADLAAGSNPKQIRNAAAAANTNYDATLQTYTAAGVPAGATINLIVPWIATAAPVATGAKLGTVGVVSNPTVANVALGPGGTAGAFWSGAVAGTYASGWKWSPGTATLSPSVTFGTAPVMRVTQVTSSTRIAMVCLMCIYVDYTPAAAPAATKKTRVLSTNVPVMRAALR